MAGNGDGGCSTRKLYVPSGGGGGGTRGLPGTYNYVVPSVLMSGSRCCVANIERVCACVCWGGGGGVTEGVPYGSFLCFLVEEWHEYAGDGAFLVVSVKSACRLRCVLGV